MPSDALLTWYVVIFLLWSPFLSITQMPLQLSSPSVYAIHAPSGDQIGIPAFPDSVGLRGSSPGETT